MSTIRLLPLRECGCTEPHTQATSRNKGALSAEATARGIGRMLCAATDGCSRLHGVAPMPEPYDVIQEVVRGTL